MNIRININTDNDAFQEHSLEAEVVRILIDLAGKVDSLSLAVGDEIPLLDVNGNTVGSMTCRK